jgi:uncharacterized protein YbbC (DUF1343 family)
MLYGLSAGMAASLLGACAREAKAPVAAASEGVRLGIDGLATDGFAALKGKRVGLITNQTGIDRTGALTRLALKSGIGEGLAKLYGPEHGLDTLAKAGELVDTALDPVTGLTAYSLYGKHRKPTPEMLAGLDVLLFDIQDIGCRSYTYISTMALAIEAAGEAGLPFMVLDRPNPLGGVRVQGPPLDPAFTSFVGQLPIPYVHGLTIGELAKMIVGEKWMKAQPALEVIPLQGWTRAMTWEDTKLPWVATSPNIRHWYSPYYYVATGVVGGLPEVDIAVGTPMAFQVAAGPGIDGEKLAADFSKEAMPGVTFKPYASAAKPGFGGVEVMIDPRGETDLAALAVMICAEIVARAKGAPLKTSSPETESLFNKVYGDATFWATLKAGGDWRALPKTWAPSLSAFTAKRKPYLLY